MADDRDRDGRTELHYASGREGSIERVRELIEAGADVNAADKKGLTPLHFASEGAQPEAVEALVAAGADIDKQDKFGNSPMGAAILVPGPEAKATVRTFLRLGANPDLKNKWDRSARDVVNDIVNVELKEMFREYPASR